ncbi:hypothetical protein KIW84_030716 [Lathyrus oleraceus]|uniref:DUF4283 domain-containing protein n=1 Tax=Pisum sativum TaxID=3888 RepID=A0A9D4XNN4_PEA|nr:hypothetical protein KIW84_030716 [Pisum sativum]
MLCKHNLYGRVLWPKGYSPLTVQQLKVKLQSMWSSISKWGVTSLGKRFFEFSFSCFEDVRRVRAYPSWNLNPDSSSNWPLFDCPFGHFLRVFVDINLRSELRNKNLVERIGCLGHLETNCGRKQNIVSKLIAKKFESAKDPVNIPVKNADKVVDTNGLEMNHKHMSLGKETSNVPSRNIPAIIITLIYKVDMIVIQEKLIHNPINDHLHNGTISISNEDINSSFEKCIAETQWNLAIINNDDVKLNNAQFLKESWANVADQADKDDDVGDPIFQYVINKSQKKEN